MSLAEDLRLIRIFNPHNLVSEGMPVVQYEAMDRSRCGHSAHWTLSLKGRAFSNQAWYQNGDMWFDLYSYERNKQKALEAALTEVQKRFPNLEMVKGPWRETWVPKKDLDAAKELLKQFKKTEKA